MDTPINLEERRRALQLVTDVEAKDPHTVYVLSNIQSFFGDPPDSEFQRGFLSAMLTVATEALLIPKQNSVIRRGEALLVRS